jgi:hypothetical protein
MKALNRISKSAMRLDLVKELRIAQRFNSFNSVIKNWRPYVPKIQSKCIKLKSEKPRFGPSLTQLEAAKWVGVT